MKRPKNRKPKPRSQADLELMHKILLNWDTRATKAPKKKLKTERPPVKRQFIYAPIDQPLSVKVEDIKAKKRSSQVEASKSYVSQKEWSYFITETEEDILHRK